MTAIAKGLGVARSSLQAWLAADPKRTQRAIDARRLSADAWDELAEEVLLSAKDHVEVARARELASHHRWKASKAGPRRL
jgi:CRISPR/Cas system-associated protein Csm6